MRFNEFIPVVTTADFLLAIDDNNLVQIPLSGKRDGTGTGIPAQPVRRIEVPSSMIAAPTVAMLADLSTDWVDADTKAIYHSNGTSLVTGSGVANITGVSDVPGLVAELNSRYTKTESDGLLSAKADLVAGVVPSSQLPPGGSSVQRLLAAAVQTTNIAVAGLLPGIVVDGVTVAAGDVVLLAGQTDAAQNGPYTVGTTPVRTAGFDTFDALAGSQIVVKSGSLAGSVWTAPVNTGGVLGTDKLPFAQLDLTGALRAANNLGDLGNIAVAKANLGLDKVPNQTAADRAALAETLTNKTIDGANNTLQNVPQAAVTGLVTGLADKQKKLTAGTGITLDPDTGEISAQAAVGVTSLNGETGDLLLDKASLGLANVDNTADLAKPLSTAAIGALLGKIGLCSGIPADADGDDGEFRVDMTPPWVGNIYKKASGAWAPVRNEVELLSQLPAAGPTLLGAIYTVTGLNCEFICKIVSGQFHWVPYSNWIEVVTGNPAASTSYNSTFDADEVLATNTIPAGLLFKGCLLHIRALCEGPAGTSGVRKAGLKWGNGTGFYICQAATSAAGKRTLEFSARVVIRASANNYAMDLAATPLPASDGLESPNGPRSINQDITVDCPVNWVVNCTGTDTLRFDYRSIMVQFPQ